MSGFNPGLQAHLESGLTSVCRAWAVTRADGQVFGFTDHDQALSFDQIIFTPDSGFSAFALEQSTGLSVDNTETLGVLSDHAITEADIEAGRFDNAQVISWLVNWQDLSQRQIIFKGTIGELTRSGDAFQAELRGLSEGYNRPLGRVYQKPCSAVLGDVTCRVNVDQEGFSTETSATEISENRVFDFTGLDAFDDGWFQHGRLIVLDGAAAGLSGIIKRDTTATQRQITLWQPLGATPVVGDTIRLVAGCDKRFETCRLKFNNVLNHQGFPDIPGDDWTITDPARAGSLDGGSRRT